MKPQTTINELPVPIGGTPDLWTAAGVRDIYNQVGYVPTSRDLLRCPAVTVVAEQRRNGSLGAIDIDIDARAGLSPAQARELARLLIAGADLADTWVGNIPNPAEKIALAKTAVERAYIAVRTAPGNAGDYLRGALDSIADAQAVI